MTTVESLAFCTAMLDSNSTAIKRYSLLRDATAKHIKQIQSIGFGDNGDNHMFGLYMSLGKPEEVPAIFTDPIYRYSTDWFISTSYMAADDMEYGFGPDRDDGWSVSITHSRRQVSTANPHGIYSANLAVGLSLALPQRQPGLKRCARSSIEEVKALLTQRTTK